MMLRDWTSVCCRGMILAALLIGTLVSGCRTSGTDDAPSGKVRVAVSIIPQVWLVEQIGGEYVDVVAMVKPGESHETYQPSDAQIHQIMNCAVLFRVGIPFESSHGLSAVLSQGRPRVVDTREGIALRDMTPLERGCLPGEHEHDAAASDHASHGHSHEGKDPHVWLAPGTLKSQAKVIARTLSEIDPEHRAAYDRNLAATEAKLAAADAEIRRLLQPYRGKGFLVYHPAWGYFADAYGLKQMAIEAEGKDPSDEEATALQRLARQEGIKVVFVQPQIASRGAESIAKAIGGRVEILDPLAPDLPDSLVRAARAIADSYR